MPESVATIEEVENIMYATWLNLTDEDLLTLLEQRHPDYEYMSDQATLGLDFLSEDRDRLITKDYLPQGNAEDDSDYNKRKSLTEPILETPGIINRTTGSVFEPDPKHEVPDDLAEFLTNADSRGLSHVQIMQDVFSKALACGAMAIWVDSTNTGDQPVLTAADAEQAGVRVIESVYDPRHILNWQYDTKGLNWIHLKEIVNRQSSFFETQQTETVHHIIDREYVYTARVIEDDSGNTTVVKEMPYPHGVDNECPVKLLIFVHDRSRGEGVGKQYVKSTLRADIGALRVASYRAIVTQIYGIPQLYRRFSDDEWTSIQNAYVAEMARAGNSDASLDYTYIAKKVKMGYTSYHLLKGDNSEIGYAVLDTGALDKLKEAEDDYRHLAVAKAGFEDADIWGEGARVTQESGISKAFSYSMGPALQLELLSMVMSIFDTSILKLACRKAGLNEEEANAIYPQPRMVAPMELLYDEYDHLSGGTYPEEIVIAAKQQIYSRMHIFDGLDSEEKNNHIKLIESHKEKEALSERFNQFGNVNDPGSNVEPENE